jgi:hypothetical protein
MRQRDRGLAPHPRRGHHALPGIVIVVAALRRLVLHAPLADLLAKRQRRQLAAALNAVCHYS